MMNSRLSRIRDHNIDPTTDHLYDPLRQVLHQRVSHVSPQVVQGSLVSHEVKILSDKEIDDFERNTYIPIDKRLVPTNHLEKIRGQRFVAVNSTERVVGGPISEADMQKIRLQGLKQSTVLYQFGDQYDQGAQQVFHQQQLNGVQQQVIQQQTVQQQQVVVQPQQPNKLNSAASTVVKTEVREVIKEVQPTTKYRSPMLTDNQAYQKTDYKYNLFSALDQPANGCRQFGLGGCTGCPGNEVIASKSKPQSINWIQ